MNLEITRTEIDTEFDELFSQWEKEKAEQENRMCREVAEDAKKYYAAERAKEAQLKKEEDEEIAVIEKIFEEYDDEIHLQSREAYRAAICDTGDTYHIVAWDTANKEVYTYHSIGWTWYEGDIILSSFQGWGADALDDDNDDDAVTVACELDKVDVDAIEEKLIAGIRGYV
jgi:hypothetical protein